MDRMKAKLDPRVDMYVEGAAQFAQPVLRHLRGLVHASCGDVEETIKWRAPFFLYRGRIVCAMMGFKAHCGFHFWGRAMRETLAEAGYTGNESMGLIGRITRMEDLPDDKLMKAWLRQAFQIAKEENALTAPAKKKIAKKTAKGAVAAPDDLAAELGKREGAAAAFVGMSASCRREYVNWIEGAKRAETRARRVAEAAGWIAEGKGRNWKYESC